MGANTGVVAFLNARLDEEEPPEACGCLKVNHWPPCVPQPWAERKRREIAADRALLRAYEASVRSVGEGLSRSLRQLVLWRAAVWNDHPDYQAGWDPDSSE